jgi:hypothetical protein
MQVPFVPSYSHEILTPNSSHIHVVHNDVTFSNIITLIVCVVYTNLCIHNLSLKNIPHGRHEGHQVWNLFNFVHNSLKLAVFPRLFHIT